MVKKKALILGVSGQDGSLLAEYLLRQDYVVYGTTRVLGEETTRNLRRLGIDSRVEIKQLDVNNPESVAKCFCSFEPNEIYNLCGPSSVSQSFYQPHQTIRDISVGAINSLEVIHKNRLDVRYYNACSSECFGNSAGKPSDELTPFACVSPYSIGKATAFYATKKYREEHGLFACSGILFNHESPLRSKMFVTQKIVTNAVQILRKEKKSLLLGNLESVRDWGWAPEFVEGMHKIISYSEPVDFVLGTGRSIALKEYTSKVFAKLGLDWKDYVTTTKELYRPIDINGSYADPRKAKHLLGWQTTKDIDYVVDQMIQAELDKSY